MYTICMYRYDYRGAKTNNRANVLSHLAGRKARWNICSILLALGELWPERNGIR